MQIKYENVKLQIKIRNRSQVHRSGFKVNDNVQYARGVSA